MLEVSILAQFSSSLNPSWSGTFALWTYAFTTNPSVTTGR
jgi:hypothetical protein